MRSSVRLFKIKGVPVGINWTWVFVSLFVLWSLGTVMFPTTYPGHAGSTYFVMAVVTTVLFFASLLAHELSHTLRAMREGVRVGEITLWLFGGVSRAEDPIPTPAAEMRVVAAGPLTSGALALGFLAVAVLARAAGLSEAVHGIPDYLARINALLMAFNLVPGLPLDGGRILHAVLWRRTGDRAGATISAAKAGRAFGALLMAIGVVGLLSPTAGDIWFLFLGWFLFQAAGQEALGAMVERTVGGLRVRDLMALEPVTVRPDMTIDEFTGTIAPVPDHVPGAGRPWRPLRRPGVRLRHHRHARPGGRRSVTGGGRDPHHRRRRAGRPRRRGPREGRRGPRRRSELFVVPAAERSSVREGGLRVGGTSNLGDALQFLRGVNDGGHSQLYAPA